MEAESVRVVAMPTPTSSPSPSYSHRPQLRGEGLGVELGQVKELPFHWIMVRVHLAWLWFLRSFLLRV